MGDIDCVSNDLINVRGIHMTGNQYILNVENINTSTLLIGENGDTTPYMRLTGANGWFYIQNGNISSGSHKMRLSGINGATLNELYLESTLNTVEGKSVFKGDYCTWGNETEAYKIGWMASANASGGLGVIANNYYVNGGGQRKTTHTHASVGTREWNLLFGSIRFKASGSGVATTADANISEPTNRMTISAGEVDLTVDLDMNGNDIHDVRSTTAPTFTLTVERVRYTTIRVST